MKETELDDLMTIKALAKRYPDAVGTESSIRWYVFNAEDNGLAESGAIVRRGRLILIDVPRYRNWLLRGRVAA